MTFDEFQKELAEKKATFKAAETEYERAGKALQAFYKDNLGVDAQGRIEIDQVSEMVAKIVDMKGGNA